MSCCSCWCSISILSSVGCFWWWCCCCLSIVSPPFYSPFHLLIFITGFTAPSPRERMNKWVNTGSLSQLVFRNFSPHTFLLSSKWAIREKHNTHTRQQQQRDSSINAWTLLLIKSESLEWRNENYEVMEMKSEWGRAIFHSLTSNLDEQTKKKNKELQFCIILPTRLKRERENQKRILKSMKPWSEGKEIWMQIKKSLPLSHKHHNEERMKDTRI